MIPVKLIKRFLSVFEELYYGDYISIVNHTSCYCMLYYNLVLKDAPLAGYLRAGIVVHAYHGTLDKILKIS